MNNNKNITIEIEVPNQVKEDWFFKAIEKVNELGLNTKDVKTIVVGCGADKFQMTWNWIFEKGEFKINGLAKSL